MKVTSFMQSLSLQRGLLLQTRNSGVEIYVLRLYSSCTNIETESIFLADSKQCATEMLSKCCAMTRS